MTRKKVARETEKRLSMKDLDERLEKLAGAVEKLVLVQGGGKEVAPEDQPEPVDPAPPREPPPLEEGRTYIFCSGPHKEQKLRITPGGTSDRNMITGEYTLIPPEVVDFGAMDEDSGPKGFHVISNATKEDLEEVKKIRTALKAVITKDIIEVTGDPAFEYVTQL